MILPILHLCGFEIRTTEKCRKLRLACSHVLLDSRHRACENEKLCRLSVTSNVNFKNTEPKAKLSGLAGIRSVE